MLPTTPKKRVSESLNSGHNHHTFIGLGGKFSTSPLPLPIFRYLFASFGSPASLRLTTDH